MTAVANLAVEGFEDPRSGKRYRIDPETGDVMIANSPQYEGGDEGGGGAPPMPPRRRRPAPPPQEMAPEEEEDYEEEPPAPPTGNRRRRGGEFMTNEEFLRRAPAALRDEIDQARQIVQQKKDQIIGQLLANVIDPDQKNRQYEILNNRSLEELQFDLMRQPKLPEAPAKEEPVRNRQMFRPVQDNDTLDLPTWNKLENEEESAEGGSSSYAPVSNFSEFDEEAWLQQAPPSIRAKLLAANQIENQEKRRIVARLTENVANEEEEAKMAQRLMLKPLEDLRMMERLLPPARRTTQNYFGTPPVSNGKSGSLSQNSGGALDRNEDILPLPGESVA